MSRGVSVGCRERWCFLGGYFAGGFLLELQGEYSGEEEQQAVRGSGAFGCCFLAERARTREKEQGSLRSEQRGEFLESLERDIRALREESLA